MVAIERREHSVTKRRPRIGPRLSQIHIGFWRLLVFVVLVALWALVAHTAGQNFVPSPIETARAAVQLFADGTVPAAGLSSLYVFLTGYLLSIVVAVPLGLLMGGFRVFGS